MAAVQESPSREDRQSNIAPRPRGPAVLVVDDDREMCELAEAGLSQRGYSVTWRMSPEEALALLEQEDFAVLFVDIHMEGMSGLDLCRAALAKRPDLVVVVMTGFGSLEHAIGAMRAGAYDFITKPVPMDALALTLERAVRHRAMSDELRRLRRRVETRELPRVVGSSPVMQRVADLVDRVADSETNVLITGESGTGKELVARAIHERSGRRGPFLAINCAAMPENLLESELFGHVRGAFTDARSARTGLFVEADQGSLFLDEIGEMPMGMQAKILRALQERKVRPLGSSQELQFDARIIAATNRDLDKEVAEKRFREDLFYRINVVRIDVPPLRARGNDMLLLAQHFLERAAQRSGKSVTRLGRLVAERLISYDWPGNVRELENCMERAVALARFDEITLDDLPPKIREHRATEVYTPSDDPNDLPPMDTVEERYIRKVLAAVGGNKTLAAKVLGFDRRTLYRKLERYQ
ncbi:MAG TPA: sigma-54 dependent transcriptional regulator [Polyangiaceae bacterium]|nr:sigma-54 dependent transcriptional regulator [Polyangiaceae bacterium]